MAVVVTSHSVPMSSIQLSYKSGLILQDILLPSKQSRLFIKIVLVTLRSGVVVQETSFRGRKSQRTKLMKDYVRDLYEKLSEPVLNLIFYHFNCSEHLLKFHHVFSYL